MLDNSPLDVLFAEKQVEEVPQVDFAPFLLAPSDGQLIGEVPAAPEPEVETRAAGIELDYVAPDPDFILGATVESPGADNALAFAAVDSDFILGAALDDCGDAAATSEFSSAPPPEFVSFVPQEAAPRVHRELPAGAEQRRSERIRVQIPIRVIGFDEARGRFIEDTHTLVISETGSLIAMKHKVFPADTVRIINLENLEEADFRVVGPSIVNQREVYEWGIECIDRTRNIWGIEFPPPLAEDEAGALLECRACHKQTFWPATLLEVEVLLRTGMIALDCEHCRRPTYWIYAEVERRPAAFALADAVAPPPRVVPIRETAERRKNKRVLIKLPIHVRSARGDEEVLHTENMSKGGFAALLKMELEEGETVTVMVPYIENGTNIAQRVQVCWRDPYPSSNRRYYGMKFVRQPVAPACPEVDGRRASSRLC